MNMRGRSLVNTSKNKTVANNTRSTVRPKVPSPNRTHICKKPKLEYITDNIIQLSCNTLCYKILRRTLMYIMSNIYTGSFRIYTLYIISYYTIWKANNTCMPMIHLLHMIYFTIYLYIMWWLVHQVKFHQVKFKDKLFIKIVRTMRQFLDTYSILPILQ